MFIFDTTGSFEMLNAIEYLPEEEISWRKDFKFFDNVVAMSASASTYEALPIIVGGSNYNVGIQIKELRDNMTPKKERIRNRKYFKKDISFWFSSEALEGLEELLDNNIYIGVEYIGTGSLRYDKEEEIEVVEIRSPIMALSLYAIMPYFMRHLVVDKDSYKSWNYKFASDYKWVYVTRGENKYLVEFEKTTMSTFNAILTWGLHPPLSLYSRAEIIGLDGKDDVQIQINQIMSYQFGIISQFIDKLKEYNIYNNTRIIITSDNGRSRPLVEMYYKGDDSSKPKPSYNIGTISSFIMDKDFNSKDVYKIDDRSLAGMDIHSIIVTSFTNRQGYVDYTKAIPPKRIFNFPLIRYEEELLINTEVNDGKFKYLEVRDLETRGYEYLYPYETIDELPLYEIVE